MADEAGDSNITSLKFHGGDFDDNLLDVPPSLDPLPVKKPFRVTYPPSLDTQIKKLRISLDNWKEIILPVKSILLWEKQWHPTALLGASTILFTLIWLINPSLLSAICIIGLIIVVSDYFVPTLSSTIFKNDKWTSQKERELEELCASMVLYKTKFDLLCASYYRMRSTNPKMYFCLTVLVLLFLAWLGSAFNNLLLMYLTVTFLLIIPGMEHHGMLVKIKASSRQALSSFLDNARAKLTESKATLKKTN